MKKVFFIEKVGTIEYQTRLRNEVLPDSGNRVPAARIIDAISAPPLSCASVVFEKDYIDKDYQDELAIFYCKAFKQYSHRCTRLHFFGKEIPNNPSNPVTDFAPYADHYLGLMVLRPTDLQRVGRTYIKPTVTNPDIDFITCSATFTAHILGHEFQVRAMPFMQQDTQVGACAQACLWMVARYMSRRFGHRELLPAEINYWAKSHSARGRHYPAESGLTFVQMLDGLQGMGLSATSYQKISLDESQKHVAKAFPITADSTKEPDVFSQQLNRQRTAKLADIAYRYIESGLPVIFGMSNHALVGVGYKYDPAASAMIAIQRVPAFYVHNDNTGPYIEMPLFGPIPGTLTFDQIHLIIVVIPQEATLSGEEAERVAVLDIEQTLLGKPNKNKSTTLRHILSTYRPEFAAPFSSLEYRTYLRRSVDFQRDLREDVATRGFDPAVADKLIQLKYPKYVWITEASSTQFLNHTSKAQRMCIGRVIVDSTAPAPTRGVMANHFADVLILNDRQGIEPSLWSIHRNSTPFAQKIMTQ
jgi:hypothetical protein